MRTVHFTEIDYLFAGLNTGLPSCYFTTYSNIYIFCLSPCTKMIFYAFTCRIRFIIPFASAWAEKDMFYTFMFTSYYLWSIYSLRTPLNSLLPNVPGTQYPGIIIVFFYYPHHYLKTCNDVPPWSMPGVAKRTYGISALIRDLSKGFTFLKLNRLLHKKSYLIF